MKTFRAFGPTIGKTKLSKKIISILNNHVDKTQSSIKNDYSSKLASQIKSEIKIPKTIVNKNLSKEIIKNIATAASLFILINSLSGLAGQFTKSSTINGIYDYWPLFLTVLIGGQIGNYLNLKIFPARMLALVTSSLVIFVAIRMGLKLFA